MDRQAGRQAASQPATMSVVASSTRRCTLSPSSSQVKSTFDTNCAEPTAVSSAWEAKAARKEQDGSVGASRRTAPLGSRLRLRKQVAIQQKRSLATKEHPTHSRLRLTVAAKIGHVAERKRQPTHAPLPVFVDGPPLPFATLRRPPVVPKLHEVLHGAEEW